MMTATGTTFLSYFLRYSGLVRTYLVMILKTEQEIRTKGVLASALCKLWFELIGPGISPYCTLK